MRPTDHRPTNARSDAIRHLPYSSKAVAQAIAPVRVEDRCQLLNGARGRDLEELSAGPDAVSCEGVNPLRPHLVRATVRVHAYPDGTLAIFKGPHRLASFPPAAPATSEDLAA